MDSSIFKFEVTGYAGSPGATASGTITVTDYAALLINTADTVAVNGIAFTAVNGTAVEGEPNFNATVDNDTTAASLAAQINAHPDTSILVSAVAVGNVVTITAIESGTAGNAITLVYTDNDSGSDG